jgi:predicted transcriptional regulator of viral defense system
MVSRSTGRYAQSQGLILLEAATKEFGPIFTIEQVEPLATGLQISRPQLRWLLSSLTRSGWLETLKRGTYVARSTLFANDVSPFAVTAALVQPCAISHWSALEHHGFTTQIPMVVQASTPRKVVTPEMRKGHANRPRGRAVWKALGIEVEFIHVQMKHFFGHQKIWANSWQQVAITDPERSLLDLIARSDIFGGFSTAAEMLEGALGQIQPDRLVTYTLQYQVGAVVKRMGWLLEQLEIPAEIIAPLLTYPVTNYYRLEPQGSNSGRAISRWRIIDNLRRPIHA